jgi:exosortase
MSAIEQKTRGGWWQEPLWLLVVGYWVWLIWACAGEWSGSEDYNYGWFVPPLALYFLWKRLESEEPGTSAAPTSKAAQWAAWATILFSLAAILPLEIVRQTPIHWRPTLWAIGVLAASLTLAVTWVTGGVYRLRVFFVPTIFMLVAIPWPTFVENSLSFPLMQVVTSWSVALLHLLGYPATAAGTTITLPNCTVGVEQACSGLRSLQTALMVGLAAGELARLSNWGRAVLLIVAFIMAIAGNQVRVLILALSGISGGNAAVEQVHDTAGYVVLGILLAGVGLAALALSLAAGDPPRDRWRVAGGAAANPGSVPHSRRRGWILVGLAALAILSAHGWYWVRGGLAAKPVRAMLAPVEVGGFVVDDQVPPSILGVLNPDEYHYIRESAEGGGTRVIGYHFYWNPRKGNANQLYHRPDRCMPGAGWRIDGPVSRETVRVAGRDLTFNVFPFSGPNGPALMLWGSYLNGEPVEIDFNADVYLNTANLWQFIRTGTRIYSYEVAAFIMPYREGHRPSAAEVEAYANRVFSATAAPGGAG